MACRCSIGIEMPRSLPIRRPPNSLLPFLYPRLLNRSFAELPTLARRVQSRDQKKEEKENHEKAVYSDSSLEGGNARFVSSRQSRHHDPSSRAPNEQVVDASRLDIPWDSTFRPTGRDSYKQAPPSTMTDIEKDAFERLFGTLVSPNTQNLTTRPSEPDIKSHQQRSKRPEESYVSALGDEIRSVNLEDQQPPSTTLDSDFDVSHIYAEQISPDALDSLARYPTSIRQMAKRASILRVMEQERTNTQDPIIKKANAEMLRIEKLLLACKTDKQIYKVMEAEVFSKVDEAQAQEKAIEAAKEQQDAIAEEGTEGRQKRSKLQRGKSKTRTQGLAEAREQEGKAAETLQLLTHTCAPLMLLSVRLLQRANPQSGMALALLQTARSRGATSYALAASTPLYNALLKQKWRTSMQYTPVLALLEEMQQAGLYMDRATLEAIEDISEYRRRALWGWFGQGVTAVEESRARHAEGEQIEGWRERIWNSIQEMEIERAQRAQERKALELEEQQDRATAAAAAAAAAAAESEISVTNAINIGREPQDQHRPVKVAGAATSDTR